MSTDGDAASPYGRVDFGSSWVMTVRMDPETGPQGEAILTYSQSTNPTSPHFADQTRLFSQKKWVPMRFTEQEIASDPELTVRRVHDVVLPCPATEGHGSPGTGSTGACAAPG